MLWPLKKPLKVKHYDHLPQFCCVDIQPFVRVDLKNAKKGIRFGNTSPKVRNAFAKLNGNFAGEADCYRDANIPCVSVR